MSKSSKNLGLSPLIAPHSIPEFFASSWPEKPFVVHGLNSTIAPLSTLPFLKSLDAMLETWPHPVQAHLPDVADEASSIDVSTKDAKKLFQNGMGLLFNRVDRISPVLKEWLKTIHADLGLPAMADGRCMVYATPDNKGTSPHFDQNINFVLQLTGIKKWWLAPNENVAHPSERHTLGQEVNPELASYAKLPFPKQMPSKKTPVVLKPGSLLFVPQGYWHSTEARGEALSLNFTFNQPSYVDLFMAALRSRLLLSPVWRQLADGVSAKDKDRKLHATEILDLLLDELKSDLPEWKAEDILGATEIDF